VFLVKTGQYDFTGLWFFDLVAVVLEHITQGTNAVALLGSHHV